VRVPPGQESRDAVPYGVWSTSWAQMNDFGLDVGMYFVTLAQLVVGVLVYAALSVVAMIHFSSDQYSGQQVRWRLWATRVLVLECFSGHVFQAFLRLPPKTEQQAIQPRLEVIPPHRSECSVHTPTRGWAGGRSRLMHEEIAKSVPLPLSSLPFRNRASSRRETHVCTPNKNGSGSYSFPSTNIRSENVRSAVGRRRRGGGGGGRGFSCLSL